MLVTDTSGCDTFSFFERFRRMFERRGQMEELRTLLVTLSRAGGLRCGVIGIVLKYVIALI